jgi:hypothetical protein
LFKLIPCYLSNDKSVVVKNVAGGLGFD